MQAPERVFPEYDGHCLSNVPAAVVSVLGGGPNPLADAFADADTDVENVVLLLVDGFGLDRWNSFAPETPFFRRFETHGRVTPLTSIYPSETAAAVTTLHTGVTAADHGVVGWHLHRPDRGRVQPLPYTGDDAALGDDPVLVDRETVYERLTDDGVDSCAIQPAATLGTPYAEWTLAGADTRASINSADAAHHLRQVLETASGPTYTYVYLPELDALAHRDGAGTRGWRAQVAAVGSAFARTFDALDRRTAERTLVCATADHGILNTDPGETIDPYELPAFARPSSNATANPSSRPGAPETRTST